MTIEEKEKEKREKEERKKKRIARVLGLIGAFVLLAALIAGILYFRQELVDLVRSGLNDTKALAQDVIS